MATAIAGREVESSLSPAQVDAIAAGDFRDVFSVLGPHKLPGDRGWVIRAFLPWAGSVQLIRRATGTRLGAMRELGGGYFERVLPKRKSRPDYCFLVNGEIRYEDPYRFPSVLSEEDFYLFNEGAAERAYRWLGAHGRIIDSVAGVLFAVWAPAASRVSIVGDFNGWDGRQHVMRKHPASGVWEIFIPQAQNHAHYKYEIVDAAGKRLPLKTDPYARSMQHPPDTAARVMLEEEFRWTDQQWLNARDSDNYLRRPVSIYEVHTGSWRRKPDQDNRYLSYLELAEELIAYVLDMGFTHIELMPITEFPFDGSWGYQPIGMFAPSIRFGTPAELKYFINECHHRGIGVLLDWVPGHFPTDTHGLGRFDGSCLYEHEDIRKGFQFEWKTLIYNYGRAEVVSYLLSSANFWLDEFHFDGLRVDAVASMLYLDYSREEGEWLPNEYGGRENLEAVELLRKVNSSVYRSHPGVMMIAEESTAWPGVSNPVDQDGLGFGYKWNMGWMNDTLEYMRRDPVHRKFHHGEMTFGTIYAWSEKYILPLSHDEVVHGKASMLEKMPGDDWQKFANLRAYYGFMWAQPGKKLLFMGGEFGQRREWDHDTSLDWHLLEHASHRGLLQLVRDLNFLYRRTPALFERDTTPEGFEWVQADSSQLSVYAWLRRSDRGVLLAVSNMTPECHHYYRLGVPAPGRYQESLNTDAEVYGGSGQGNGGGVWSQEIPWDGKPHSVVITLPPLATVLLLYTGS